METKNCQNCKNNFVIEAEDFSFYEKIKVPPPTFCSECSLIRRMAFRNERTLYRSKCQALNHGEDMLSTFSPDKNATIYCHSAWWGDTWDGLSYGRDYDFSNNFFDQINRLWREVPDIGLFNINPVNSDYCSITEGNKNCYLVIGGDFNEDSLYSAFIFNSKFLVDCYWVSKSEWNYETIDCISCSKLLYSRYCEGCYGSAFLFNCRNCHDCFGCVNLSNKSYCIFNEQYSREEYTNKMKEYNLSSYSELQKIKLNFSDFNKKFPRRYAKIIKSVEVTGDDIEESKNCKNSFSIFGGAEDSKNLWLVYSSVKNCYGIDHSGLSSVDCYEVSSAYPGNRVLFSRFIFGGYNIEYSYNCHNCSNLFACIGLRNKQYCILNKQYSKEDYESTIEKIKAHMDEKKYIDQGGRVYGYGEFFPIELSPFLYNETVAQELKPISVDEASLNGIKLMKNTERNYVITINDSDLADSIEEVTDSILDDIISCAHKGSCSHECSTAFKITKTELEFYRNLKIPIPHLCPNCRHYERISQRNPMKLWHRSCMCDKSGHIHEGKCEVEFETSYSPDRPEIIYCEKCYQAEVI
jgi:hypothetical protein